MANLYSLKRLRTSRYLKLSQLLYYIVRRGLPARSVKIKQAIYLRVNTRLVKPISVNNIYVSDNEIEFLNVSKNFAGSHFDWQPKDMSRLWQYNLHYFDYLREPERSLGNKKSLINDWIEFNQQGSQPGWEPFTVSLRIVNWIFFFLTVMKHENVPQSWLNSLFEQALWLSMNDEKHILANHYFENIKALLFAGVYFQGKTADIWLKKSQQLLYEQLHEQFLEDGGHFEKSPLYHCFMLENCLDIYNIIANNRSVCDIKLQSILKKQIEHSLHWLSEMQFHGGWLPLFNDSVHNLAPNYLELSQYARELFLYESEASIVSGGKIIELDASGYYGIETGLDKFLIDCGDISPSYQPGHTHCDFLSYELAFNNQMIVVDSGVFEYAEGKMRDYVRSTNAHNTISVDGDEQSEVWAAFRVARRAKKLYAEITRNNHGATFKGGYVGFYAVKGKAKHYRQVDVFLDDANNSLEQIRILDKIHVSGKHLAENYLHIHPSIECDDQGKGIIQLIRNGEPIAKVVIDRDCIYKISHSFYCPEFGVKLKNSKIVMKKAGKNNISMSYKINKV